MSDESNQAGCANSAGEPVVTRSMARRLRKLRTPILKNPPPEIFYLQAAIRRTSAAGLRRREMGDEGGTCRFSISRRRRAVAGEVKGKPPVENLFKYNLTVLRRLF